MPCWTAVRSSIAPRSTHRSAPSSSRLWSEDATRLIARRSGSCCSPTHCQTMPRSAPGSRPAGPSSDGRHAPWSGAASLTAELARIRGQGYATEEQENEVGISCLAVPVFLTSTSVPVGAISISALDYRTPLASLVEALPEIKTIADLLGYRAA